MQTSHCLLIRALRDISVITAFSLSDWDLFIRQARQANLLSKIYYLLDTAKLLSQVPEKPLHHLQSIYYISQRHSASARWEITEINKVLAPVNVPVILLKGTAYLAQNLDIAKGRLFNDLDILVPKQKIEKVEKELWKNGWLSFHHNEYDQRYYRQWMHELPPLKHENRGTVLDVHHTILPETSKLTVNTEKLFQDIIPVAGSDNIYTFSQPDLILHSATHLFSDGELEHGLRDLSDLDGLIRDFSAHNNDFWQILIERAFELGLERPLFYAVRYCRLILETPVADKVSGLLAPCKPNGFLLSVLDRLFIRALMPPHKSCDDRLTSVARFALYIRSHYLRMPLYLLIPHLLRKFFFSDKERV